MRDELIALGDIPAPQARQDEVVREANALFDPHRVFDLEDDLGAFLMPPCPTSDPVQTHQPQIRVYFMKTNSVNGDNEPPPYSSLFSADSPTSEPTPRIE